MHILYPRTETGSTRRRLRWIRVARSAGFTLALLIGWVGCQPPKTFEDNREAYTHVRNLAHFQYIQTGKELMNSMQASPGLRRAMLDLGLEYVLYDTSKAFFYTWRGGGYSPETGYLYLFPTYDSTNVNPCGAKTVRDLSGGWWECKN